MRKIRKYFLASFIACMLAALSIPVAAYAAKPVTAKIPVAMKGEMTDERFECVLSGTDLQENSHCKASTETVTLGDGETSDITFTVDYPGTYSFQISQKKGTDINTIYDENVYQIKIFAVESGSGVLSAQPIVFKEGDSDKETSVSFSNLRKDTEETQKDVMSDSPAGSTPNGPQTGDGTPLAMIITLIITGVVMVLAGINTIRNKAGKEKS